MPQREWEALERLSQSGSLHGHPKPASRPGYQRRHAAGLERQLEGVLAGIAVDLHVQRSVLGLDD